MTLVTGQVAASGYSVARSETQFAKLICACYCPLKPRSKTKSKAMMKRFPKASFQESVPKECRAGAGSAG